MRSAESEGASRAHSHAAAAGVASGVVVRLVVSPLDVLKIRFQLQREPTWTTLGAPSTSTYRGVRQALVRIVREEGVSALWRGNVPALWLYATYMGVQFPVYEASARLLRSLVHAWTDSPVSRAGLDSAASATAGAVAGAVATVATYPFDLARTRLAAQGVPRVHPSMSSLLRAVATQDGVVPGWYRGLIPSLAQIVPSAAITFSVHDFVARRLQRVLAAPTRTTATAASASETEARGHGGGGAHSSNAPSLASWTYWRQWLLESGVSTVSGSTAGVAAKLAVYPLDTVKRRLQTRGMERPAYLGAAAETGSGRTWACLVATATHEGVAGLYKGVWPSLLKSAVGTGTTFFVYDAVARALDRSFG